MIIKIKMAWKLDCIKRMIMALYIILSMNNGPTILPPTRILTKVKNCMEKERDFFYGDGKNMFVTQFEIWCPLYFPFAPARLAFGPGCKFFHKWKWSINRFPTNGCQFPHIFTATKANSFFLLKILWELGALPSFLLVSFSTISTQYY